MDGHDVTETSYSREGHSAQLGDNSSIIIDADLSAMSVGPQGHASHGPSSPIPGINGHASPNEVMRKKLNSYVGFASLPNQVHRRSVKRGFNFTVMIVGEAGLGKSTLINTLFEKNILDKGGHSSAFELGKTVEILPMSEVIEESNVRLNLTLIDTPGFGDTINNSDAWTPILNTIEQRFEAYMQQENRVNRTSINDERIHACLYFIQPTGHALKEIDLEFMRRLHRKVNLIPVIAKADTMTDSEVAVFKKRILADLERYGVEIFRAPSYDHEDEETEAENAEIMSKIPFAVVASTDDVKTKDGRLVRGRAYPWGVIEVDNEDHCDFVKLRQMLIRTHMEELRAKTNQTLYEQWRYDKLTRMGVTQDQSVFKEVDPTAKANEERRIHDIKLSKMETEMKTVFQQKVKEKEQKLKQSEEELYARHREMKDTLERQRNELLEKKKRIESGTYEPERSGTKSKGKFGLGSR